MRTRLMYHAACKVEFQPFKRLYSQLTFFNFLYNQYHENLKSMLFFTFIIPTQESESHILSRNQFSDLIPVTMETRCFHKKLEFQRYPPKDFCTARYERKPSKKSFKLFKNPEKNNSWADLGPRSA